MTARLLIHRLSDRVVVTLNRPQEHNAIDGLMIDELHTLFDDLEVSPKVLIIHGANETFAAGADIRELRARCRDAALSGLTNRMTERLARLPLPTIAAIDGIALGASAEVAYACDFRLATARSKIGNPEPQLGILAAAGACWRLRELVGVGVAKEILLAGRMLTGDEARGYGLVASLHEPTEILGAANALADRIVRADALALRLTKLALHASPDTHPTFDNGAQAVLFEPPEKTRRMDEFLETRRPR